MVRPFPAVRLLAIIVLTVSLKGCITTATVVGAAAGSLAVDSARRNSKMEAALAGDAAAQTAVGKSYCCSGPGYSAEKATEWLCKAARQDHGPAFYQLGRIYGGEVSHIPHPATLITSAVTSKKHLPLALMWLSLAEERSVGSARRKINVLRWNYRDAEVLFERALGEAEAMKANWRSQPCTYGKVFA